MSKDYIGQSINVGDICVFASGHRRNRLSMCKVVNISDDCIEILSLNDYYGTLSKKTGKTFPDRLVVVTNTISDELKEKFV